VQTILFIIIIIHSTMQDSGVIRTQPPPENKEGLLKSTIEVQGYLGKRCGSTWIEIQPAGKAWDINIISFYFHFFRILSFLQL
jgi:hypothetical protein